MAIESKKPAPPALKKFDSTRFHTSHAKIDQHDIRSDVPQKARIFGDLSSRFIFARPSPLADRHSN